MYLRIGNSAAALFATILMGRTCSEPGSLPGTNGGADGGLGVDWAATDAETDSGSDGTASTGTGIDSGMADSEQGADEGSGADAIPDVNAPSEAAGGNDGGASDPLSFSATSFVFGAACGSTPESASLTITNVSSSPATWLQYSVGPVYTLSPNGSTLAAGASVTVTISAPPIPAVPYALTLDDTSLGIYSTTGDGVLEIAEGGDTVTSTNGELFTNAISVIEDVEGCISTNLPASTTLAFGDVPVGSTAGTTFCEPLLQASCSQEPAGSGGQWAIEGGCSVVVAPFTQPSGECGDAGVAFSVGTEAMSAPPGDCWPISFTPETVGTQSASLSLTYLSGETNCWAPISLTLTGTGVADAGP
jgi:hypothetical protein